MRGRVIALALVALMATFSLPTATAEAALPQALTDLLGGINQYRSSNGLSTVSVSPTLTASAQWMADSLAANNYFSHTSIDGRSPFQRMSDAGYPVASTWTGENIAAGQTVASQVLTGWEQSPTHNAVLLNTNYRAVGLGIAYNAASTYGWYWVADFGGVVDSAPAPAPVTTPASVSIGPDGYHAAWALQSESPTLAPGSTATLVIAYRNTGSQWWLRGVAGRQANLGTSAPLDRTYPLLQWGWPSENRLAIQTTDSVAPGQLGWFSFSVRAPLTTGTYVLAVRPVIDGTTWLEDYGAYFVITVR